MPGGLIQLATYGAHDFYLTNQPQISYFKSVYRRYTNFATEMIEVSPTIEGRNLQTTGDIDLTFEIPRDADLVKSVFFTFTLPAIFSNHTYTGGRKFNWVQRIGEVIIKHVSLEIGGREIDKHYGEWLQIWSELTMTEAQKDGYNRMIGNVVEMYGPEAIENIDGYPASSSTIPSIRSRKIYVPMRFFFNESYSQALPLIAMQYDSAPKLVFKLRPLEELYTIVDTDRKKPTTTTANHNFGYYTSHDSQTSVSSYDINPNLEVEYIFLDRDERKRFALSEHQYLIHQVQYREDTIAPSTIDSEVTKDLDMTHPITELVWIARRGDHEDANIWHNYTNWATTLDPLRTYTGTIDSNPYGSHSLTAQDNSSYLEQNIIVNSVLKLNGFERFATKSWEMFNLVNNYQHCERIPTVGINTYSFALAANNPKQPSGSINFSRFNTIELRNTYNKKCSKDIFGTTDAYNYRLMVFGRNINVFRIIGGMSNIEFSN